MAIQFRRGAYNDFDPTNMVEGEPAVVKSGDPNTSDGKSMYVSFATGSAKRIPTADEISDIQDDVTDIQGDISDIQGDISDIQGDISDIQGDITTIQGNVSTLQGNVSTLQGNVSTLQGETSTLEDDVETLQNTSANATAFNPDLGAGYAKQLLSTKKMESQTPFLFRKTPDGAGTLAYRKIVGGSVVWNQLMDVSQTSSVVREGITWTNNADGTWTVNGTATANSTTLLHTMQHLSDAVKENHKYLIDIGYDDLTGASFRTEIISRNANNQNAIYVDLFKSTIVNAEETGTNLYCELRVFSGVTANNFKFSPQLFDLTAMLGSTVADYVYTLESSTAGSGVAWLKKYGFIDGKYHPYSAPTMKHVQGLTAVESVGFNQWDEEWRNGFYDGSTGAFSANANYVANKNAIRILPGTSYYFNIPLGKEWVAFWYDSDMNFISRSGMYASNPAVLTSPVGSAYLNFYLNNNYGTTYNHDICINISNTAKNGQYEPYEKHTYALDPDWVGRGILKLDANNEPYFDGDVYEADGTQTERYGIVDLGTLTWSAGSGFFYSSYGYKKEGNSNLICSAYQTSTSASAGNMDDKSIKGQDGTKNLYLKDSAYSTVDALVASLSGVYMVYELATPTTSTGTPFVSPQIVNPDGTESFVYDSEAFPIPVSHVSEYPADVSGQLDDILDTPTANGTYILQATVTDGAVAYEWVSA